MAVICIGELLALGGEAHLVIRGQVFGSCIHHAPLLGIAPQSSKFPIAVAVIQASLGALLMLPARVSLLGGTR